MQVSNAVLPDAQQLDAFLEGGSGSGPFVMLNLLKFRDHAEYPDGSDSHLTGAQAYMRYGAAVQAHLKRVGARAGFAGPVTGLMIGQVEELWDMVALAEYPSAAAMREMIEDPGYQAIAVHRAAGLAGQLNIRIAGTLP